MPRNDPSIVCPPVLPEQVSVVIPTYNRADMLTEALASIMAQTHPVLEIVVVDDGSDDHTAHVVEEFTSNGAPIIYLPGPHSDRPGVGRNRGVAATRGEWIAFLDSDDVWMPRRLERQFKNLRQTPSAEYGFCNVQRFNEDGDMNGPYLDPELNYNRSITGDVLLEPVVLPSALMLRRDAFEALGGFSARRDNEDYEFTLNLSMRSPASYVSDVLVKMRAHIGNRSVALERESNVAYIRIVRAFLAAQPDLPRATRQQGLRGLANVHYKLARLYVEVGDRPSARRHFRAFIKLGPLDRRAVQGWLYLARGWAEKWTRRRSK